jgi:ribonuclease E
VAAFIRARGGQKLENVRMLENEPFDRDSTGGDTGGTGAGSAASPAAGAHPDPDTPDTPEAGADAAPARRTRTTRRRTVAKAVEPAAPADGEPAGGTGMMPEPAALEITPTEIAGVENPADAEPAKKATRRRRKATEEDIAPEPGESPQKRTRRRKVTVAESVPAVEEPEAAQVPTPIEPVLAEIGEEPAGIEEEPAGIEAGAGAEAAEPARKPRRELEPTREPVLERPAIAAPISLLFMAAPEVGIEVPAEEAEAVRSRRRRRRGEAEPAEPVAQQAQAPKVPARGSAAKALAHAVTTEDVEPETAALVEEEDEHELDAEGRRRRRRGRRGRGRGKGTYDDDEETETPAAAEAGPAAGAEPGEDDEDDEPLTRRRRRRRRKGTSADVEASEDGVPTVIKIREPRAAADEVQGVSGSTRLEAKRQRRRDGRDQRRTRPPILTESEFLARREAVDRVMVVRQRGDRTQIGVLEDGVLVEHYVTRASAGTMAGNVYLGKVQNVLPSMEAAFVDIGRGRNAVLYAGEVNWDASGLEGRARSIEQALRSGDAVLVQVTKDPIGHKGARLTSHIALSGRHLVYVPNGNASGISRKLPDTERKRLRDVLKKLVPDGAGVIVRTAAEGASEDELARDVKRLQAQWEDIQAKAASSSPPELLYEEPDLVIRVVRDLFNEDFREIVIQGDDAYDMVDSYLSHVSPDLLSRLRRHAGTADVFAEKRVDEQILKGVDRKVFLPSGGHLVIDRTEAMTVIDVNTGKYTGAGGNLEETVTRNNLEAAEEIVRQLRLRDLGGIIVIDFIDMVLESNRELVLRRLTECLGRDRTKHQVTEITSLGLVQMTRKRIGQGLLEAFSETCEVCKGRGLIIHTEPVAEKPKAVEKAKAAPVAVSERRRSRKAAAVPQEPEYDVSAPVDAEELPDPQPIEATLDESYEADGVDETDDDEERLVSTRRRSRRGGTRRRTRP